MANTAQPAGGAPGHPHAHSSKLEDQAATAALYVTSSQNKPQNAQNGSITTKTGREFLDGNNKLSSAGAAASLKYARPQDLPSYPSSGLKKDHSAAGAAASLGWNNQKSFEHWSKEKPSAAASAAAMIAKDYKMAPLWQPEDTSNGARAALLAHRKGGDVEIWKPEATQWGNSAAIQAMSKGNTLSPQLDYGHTALGRQGSLLAATGAMSSSRKRADSTPVLAPETYPDEYNAKKNALSAATSVHRSKRSTDFSSGAGAIPYTTMSRDMYTSAPPVAPEVEEKNRQDTLRASAIAMAKGMYAVQQKQLEQASGAYAGAMAAHGNRPPSVMSDDEVQPMRFNNLQEAAQKLAQERLAKLHDEHAKNREFRDYYGHSQQSQSRLSIRGRTRRRASSEGSFDGQSRAQASMFTNNSAQVDAKKRAQDREKLIAAAQRNVTKSLHGMDERVFEDTGHVVPSLLSEWEVKAHAAAQAKSDDRMQNHGKVHIGGGQFVNQSAIDLVAARNVQPVLDEINEKAEAQREHEAALKSDRDLEARKAADKKQREKEQKDITKKLKQQEKGEKKMAKDDEKKAEKERRKSMKSSSGAEPAATTIIAESAPEDAVDEPETPVIEEPVSTIESTSTPTVEDTTTPTIAQRRDIAAPAAIRTSMEEGASARMKELEEQTNKDVAVTSPMSPQSPSGNGKVKNWLKTKFSRRMSRGQKSSSGASEKDSGKGFVGGAALTGASANNSTASLGTKTTTRDISTPVIAPLASTTAGEGRGRLTKRRDSDVSSLSESDIGGAGVRSDEDEFQEARDNFDEDLAPPPTFPVEKSASPAREAKFTEDI